MPYVKRIKSDLLLETDNNKNKYSYLIGKECEYLNKFHTLEKIDLENNLIVLKEVSVDNYTNIIKDSESGVEEILRILFKEEFNLIVNQENTEQDEIQRLLSIKDFKKLNCLNF